MKKKFGVTFFVIGILSIPNQLFAEFKLDNKSFDYGFFIGSLSETCILYDFGDISATVLEETYKSIFSSLKNEDKEVEKKVFRFANSKEFPCKDFVPSNY